jgi:hypothetical protein
MTEINTDDFRLKIRTAFAVLDKSWATLTEFQVAFITGLKKYFFKNKTLTEKQAIVLFEIITNLKTNDTKTEKNDN